MASPLETTFAIMGVPQGPELILILVVILLLFGGKKIPELMRGVGRGMGELQKGIQEGKRTMEEAMREEMEKTDQDSASKAPSSKSVPKD